GHATRPARRSFTVRLRGPALAALLLGAGWFFVGSGGPLGRVGALALALGLLATAGLLPYLADFEPEEPTSSSCLVWTAFFAPALLRRAPGRLATANVLVALLLAGVAPFSGFPVRLLALRAATQLSWQLALVLLVLLLLSAVSSFRLARSLGHPQGREAVGLGLVLATSLALGLVPGFFLA